MIGLNDRAEIQKCSPKFTYSVSFESMSRVAIIVNKLDIYLLVAILFAQLLYYTMQMPADQKECRTLDLITPLYGFEMIALSYHTVIPCSAIDKIKIYYSVFNRR